LNRLLALEPLPVGKRKYATIEAALAIETVRDVAEALADHGVPIPPRTLARWRQDDAA
jgi:hypothetical protein